jgi:plastocyanin
MRKFLATVAFVAMACAGGEKAANTASEASAVQTPAPQPAAAAPATQAGETGTVHQVKMELTADGKYVYEPAELTIKQGDKVQWINISGGPHNVAFYPDKIPAGAKQVLDAAMKDRISDLSGKLLVQPNETYEISFAGAPVGEYYYFCVPHEMLGMKAELTVTK